MTTRLLPAMTRSMAGSLLAGATVLVVAHLLFAVALETSPTSDEAPHLAAGVSYLATGDYRMNPEHPPLVKQLAAWPVWAGGQDPPLDSRAWDRADIWRFGDAFLTVQNEHGRTTLALARVVPILLSLVLAALVVVWSTRLHGAAGGLLTAVIVALDPTLLAHGALVTTDVGFTLTWLLTLAALIAVRRRNTLWRRLLAGLALGCALSTKFSALLLLPLIPLIVFWRGWGQLRPLFSAWKDVLGTTLSIVAVATCVVTLAYEGDTGLWFQGLHVMRGGAETFLLGERHDAGLLHYFLVALPIKVPPATWLVLVLAAVAGWRRTREPDITDVEADGDRRLELTVLALAGLYFFVMASLSKLNIGVRHVLPAHATLWIVAGGAARWPMHPVLSRAVAAAIIALAGVWNAWELRQAWPHPIAYASSLVGGPAALPRLLADSNVDWGQGLPALARWQKANAPDGLFLAYFGNADPAAWGVRSQRLPAYGPVDESEPTTVPTIPARLLVAISTTNLQGLGLGGLAPYTFLRDREPLVTVGGSFHVYDLSAPEDRLQLAESCARARWRRTARALRSRGTSRNLESPAPRGQHVPEARR